MLEHGGNLRAAARQYNIPLQQWIDLSTGIAPNSWPVPTVPDSVWQRLPEADDALLQSANHYYDCHHLLPVAGSQAAIQLLPMLFPAPMKVAVVSPCYGEHGPWWQRAGHDVSYIAADKIDEQLDQFQLLVLANPNNPDGRLIKLDQLLEWRDRLLANKGCLLVDEAFMDVTPEHSIAQHSGDAGLIVLRSLGKFFGLAGLRLGFVCAWPLLLQAIQNRTGPWAVNHAARWIGARALADEPWQQQQRSMLLSTSGRLSDLMTLKGFAPDGGTALFQYASCQQADGLQQALAKQAIWIRRFGSTAIRIGLPADEAHWQRLQAALSASSPRSIAS
ncbi:MAG: threonine-phosphate decarboxylase [Proteobacteria bacterium]|nr:threonine-phosphate decarboxylase [Pseudomonadota bacterium]